MKKDHLLAVLFFGTIWGASELVLGGLLYSRHVPHASVLLTVIGFSVLAFARVQFPKVGMSTAIGSCAMLYKLLNAPFFACHLLAIFLLGVAFDVACAAAPIGKDENAPALERVRREAAVGAAATWLGYALFAFIITYIVRYKYWIEPGLPKVLRHIFVSGSMAAAGNAILVPLSAALARSLKSRTIPAFQLKGHIAAVLSVLTVGLWVMAALVHF